MRLSPKGRTRQHSRMNSGDTGARRESGPASAVIRSWWRTGAHRPNVPSTPLPPTSCALQEGADGRRMRRAADPRRAPGVCARPTGGPDVQRDRPGQRDDAGPTDGNWTSGRGTPVGAPTAARRHRAADPRRPGVAGPGLEPAGQGLHRDQASGPLRRAGGEQGAGAAAPLRHRLAGVGGPVARGGDVVLGGRGLADPAGGADAAHRPARRDVPLSRRQRGHHRRRHRGRAVDRDAARTSRARGPGGRPGPGAVLLDGRPLRGRPVLPRRRCGVGGDEPPRSHQGLGCRTG